MARRVGVEREDMGSIPGPNNFLYFNSSLQIRCIILSNAHHVPSTSNNGIHHQSNPTPHLPETMVHHQEGAPLDQALTGLTNSFGLSIFSNTPPLFIQQTGPNLLSFIFLFIY